MKCAYNNCPNGGEVLKEEAIYEGRKYYHKDCYAKKIGKENCRKILESMNFVSKTINMVLKQLIDNEKWDIEYLEFTINYIRNNNQKLTNPFGIKYYLQNFNIENAFAEIKKKEAESKLKDIQFETCESSTFNYKPTKKKNIFNII